MSLHLHKYIEVGKVHGTHGVHGQIVISHMLSNPTEFMDWTALMIETTPESFIPYFIESSKQISDSEFVCTLEGINSPEQAKLICNCKIFASPLVTVKSMQVNEWQQIIGFTVTEKNGTSIGNILQVVNGVGQQYFEISYQESTMLIPIEQSWIIDVNSTTKKITIDLPDGYIDAFS